MALRLCGGGGVPGETRVVAPAGRARGDHSSAPWSKRGGRPIWRTASAAPDGQSRAQRTKQSSAQTIRWSRMVWYVVGWGGAGR
eukprot:scaffold13664_cov89-Isochrysis_galbana.AAC.2